jgi:hypothetical protein
VQMLRRAIVAVAHGFGFVATPACLPVALQALRGEFRQSRSDRRAYLIAVGVWNTYTLLAAWAAVAAYRGRDPGVAAAIALLAILGCVMAVVTYRLLGRYYAFDGAHVRCFFEDGRLLWEEPLIGLQSVTATQGVSMFLTYRLRWTERTRTIVVFEGLRKALARL